MGADIGLEARGYQQGFGNSFSSEAAKGALPQGRNSPQRPPFGLFPEQISGTAFTAPRSEQRRSWVYRLRPSVAHGPFEPYAGGPDLETAPLQGPPPTPNRLRWDPPEPRTGAVDFVDGLFTYGANGDASQASGVAVHLYQATASMVGKAFSNADGELLIVPETGGLQIDTEFGVLELAPGEAGLIPRGVKIRVALRDGAARGYVCENYGRPFRLPELGPLGSNGLAAARDFLSPEAAYEDRSEDTLWVHKFQGRLFQTTLDRSPFDVVAWHGSLAPAKYDLSRFNVIGTVSFDHPDPSIFTVLTSPSEIEGVANCDFVIFPPRWMVAEDTFRPPWFHRNVMSEFMGLVHGAYDAKARGFAPGGASLHNSMSAHGPDVETYERASAAELKPHKIEDTLAFMFESRWVIRPTERALKLPTLQPDYDGCWSGFTPATDPARTRAGGV